MSGSSQSGGRFQEESIYLDHAAATPLAAEVAAAMAEAAGCFANPSSPHAAGRRAKRLLEEAREEILSILGGRTGGASRDRLVFTSGASEANQLGLLGIAGDDPGWIGVSAHDHSSIRAAADRLAAAGWQRRELPLCQEGKLTADSLAEALDGGSGGQRILALTTVCGQTGIRQDPAALLPSARGAAAGLSIHADITQQVAWEPIGFAATPFATAALAAAKFGGPRGIGALLIRDGVAISAVIPGPQELGLRGGTEAVPLAVGFARALAATAAARETAAAGVAALQERLERGLLRAAAAAGIEAVIVGRDASRAPHVTMLALAGIDRQAAAMAADQAGVCLATGTACASGSSEPPPVLAAIGLPERFRQGGLRLSLAATTTAAAIDEAVARLGGVFSRLAS